MYPAQLWSSEHVRNYLTKAKIKINLGIISWRLCCGREQTIPSITDGISLEDLLIVPEQQAPHLPFQSLSSLFFILFSFRAFPPTWHYVFLHCLPPSTRMKAPKREGTLVTVVLSAPGAVPGTQQVNNNYLLCDCVNEYGSQAFNSSLSCGGCHIS